MQGWRFYRKWLVRTLVVVAGGSAFSLFEPAGPVVTPAQASADASVRTSHRTNFAAPEVPAVAPARGDDGHALETDSAQLDALTVAKHIDPTEPASTGRVSIQLDQESAPVAASLPPSSVEQRSFSKPRLLAQPLYMGLTSLDVRELQVRLRHAKALAAYDADGIFGPITQAAVIKFQQRNQLPATGVIDQATWDALLVQSHDPTPAEMTNTDIGPWFVSPTREVWMMELQDRLRQVGVYTGAIDGIFDDQTGRAVKRYRQQLGLPASEVMDERTWARLLRVTHNPSYADLFDAPLASAASQELDARCLSGKVVCISKQQKKLSYVVNGEIQFTRQARFSLPQYNSPEGDFRVWYKNRDTISRKFGERIPMPYAIFYNGNVAIHFSDDFAENGYDGGSHGCSQLDDYQAAKWLYEQVAVGDRVVVY